jgi:uncharacterized protein (TIGR03435 family)
MRRTPLIVATALIAVATPAAQQTAPAFEVISIKPTPPERQNQLRFDYCLRDGRFMVAGTPVIWSIAYAFGLKDFQIVGAPDWLSRFDSAYDIEARPAGAVNNQQCRLMLQSVFANRFKMTAHRESRESPVYLLTTTKDGPKLRKGGQVKLNGGVQLDASGKPNWPDGLTMSTLANILSGYTDRTVVDRTGLEGNFGITLDFSIRDGDDRVSVFTAVQDQLGLKLEPGKALVPMLVIDHIEKPSEN